MSVCMEAGEIPRLRLLGLELVLLAVSSLLCFSRLDCPLQEPEETRYAEIPRQMLVEGQFAVPILHGQRYYDKPPLLYWLIMASYRVFGVDDWSARLAASLMLFATVWSTYFWGKYTNGWRIGYCGAMILVLSAKFLQLGRMVTMNGLLCLCVVTALAAAHRAIQGPAWRRCWWMLSALACGAGLLAKGPVAVALVVPPVIVHSWFDRTMVRPNWRSWLMYLLIAVGFAGPWFICVAWQDSSFLGYFFWFHHVQRFVTPFDHQEPFWFYLPILLLGMLPWTLLLPGLIGSLDLRANWAARRWPNSVSFFVTCAVWSFMFHSAAGCKRAGYILPTMPLLALSLGHFLDRALHAAKSEQHDIAFVYHRHSVAYFGSLSVMSIVGVAGLLAIAFELVPLTIGLCISGASGVGLIILLKNRTTRFASWATCGFVTFAFLLAAVQVVLPKYAGRYALREQVLPQLYELQSDSAVCCYPHRWDSVSFYLQHSGVRAFSPQQRGELMSLLRDRAQALVFVKSDHSLNDFLRDLPEHLEFIPYDRQRVVTVGWVRPRSTIAPPH